MKEINEVKAAEILSLVEQIRGVIHPEGPEEVSYLLVCYVDPDLAPPDQNLFVISNQDPETCLSMVQAAVDSKPTGSFPPVGSVH